MRVDNRRGDVWTSRIQRGRTKEAHGEGSGPACEAGWRSGVRCSREVAGRADGHAIIDPRKSRVAWASAGHLPPLLLTTNGESSYLEGADGLMGIDDLRYQDLQRTIDEHSTLILYTDGLVERRGESLDAGLDRLARAAVAGPEEPQALCDHVLEQVLPPERQRRDDVTTVVVKIA